MNYKHRHDIPTEGLLYGFGIDDTNYPKEKRIWYKDGTSKLIWLDPIHNHWKLMLRRVFRDKGYENTYIQESWLKFSNYKLWFEKNKPQCGYDIKLIVEKDLFSSYNCSSYSEHTCLIIPQNLNAVINSTRDKNSNLPIGVYYDKTKNNYQGYFKSPNIKRNIKRFDSVREAHKFWQKGKIGILNNLIEDSELDIYDSRLKIGLAQITSNLSRAIMQDKVTVSLKGYDIREYLDSEK